MPAVESMDFDEEPSPATARPITTPDESFETAKPVQVQREAPTRDVQTHEQYLLGCFLIDEGATLDKAIQAGLASTDFTEPACAFTYSALRQMRAGGTPIALDTLVEHLGERTAQAGGIHFLLSLDSAAGTTARADHALRQILDASERRRLQRLGAEIQEAAKRGDDAEAIQAIIERAKPREVDSSSALSRRVRLQAPPPEPVTRLFLAGKPIATPGNLVTLISRAKTGKTATIGAAVAAIIGAHYDRHDIDTFGFTAPHTDEAVVLIDTEQSPYDAWTCHSRSMARANQPTDPEWLHHYALVGYGAKKLRASLPPILDKAVADHKGVFTLILDGVADFVPSVNDEVGCSEFISWLRDISVKYNCPVICVIHSNEGMKTGDDGRGWLGKELTRKAESNLLLKKTGEITTITSEKQRKAPITEKDGVAFRWDDEAGRHVTCEPSDLPQRHKGGRPKGCTFEMLESIWPKTADKALTMPQLLKYAKDEEDVSESTLRRIIKEAVQTGQLTKISGPIGPQYYMTF